MSRVISEVLSQVLYEPAPRVTADELADTAECTRAHIYKVASDGAELSASKAARLARHLCSRGDYRLARCFVSYDTEIVPRGAGTANGCINDEAGDLLAAAGQVVTAFRSGDRARMDRALEAAGRALDNARAERDRL